jgi:hypothetical protein
LAHPDGNARNPEPCGGRLDELRQRVLRPIPLSARAQRRVMVTMAAIVLLWLE